MIASQVDGKALDIEPRKVLPAQSGSVAFGKKVAASNVYQIEGPTIWEFQLFGPTQ